MNWIRLHDMHSPSFFAKVGLACETRKEAVNSERLWRNEHQEAESVLLSLLCECMYLTMLLGFVTVVYRLFDLCVCVCACVDDLH